MHSQAITLEVAQRFHSLRRRFVITKLLATLAVSIALFATGWSILAVGDYLWEWPAVARRILIALTGVGAVAWLCIQGWGIARDSQQRRFVGRLEQRFGSLGQRLRTVLETVDGRLKAPAAMLAALGHQTLGRWETASPYQIVPHRFAIVAAIVSMAVTAVPLFCLSFPSDWRIAMLRAVGQDVPYTLLHVLPGDTRLLEGTPLTLTLELVGRTERGATLRYRVGSDATWTERKLLADATEEPTALPPERVVRLDAKLGKLTEPVEYQYVTSAGSTRYYRVDVKPFIEVSGMQTLVTPPAYTRLAPRSFDAAEVSVLSGSQVLVTIETNHPLTSALLTVGEKAAKQTTAPVSANSSATHWTFILPSQTSLHWKFSGSGEEGTPMEPVTGRLRVRYDEPPRIEWRDPDDELKVHMLAEVPMRAQVSDDFGITAAAIVFQLGDENEFVLAQWSDDASAANEEPSSEALATQFRLEETLPLESFALSEHDFIAYYAYAVDNRAGSEQRVETEVRYIDIRPLRQFFSESDDTPEGQGGGGNPVPELDELIRRERYLINRTRKIVREPLVSNDQQLALIERMAENQSELADLTRFLAEFLIFRGSDDTEALSQAEAAMLQAADSLSAADFELALAHEEDALRALAEARRELDAILPKQMSPQQAAQLRNLRRQLRQKLRREPTKSDEQLADSLQQIAAEQKSLSDDAEKRAASATEATAEGRGDPSEGSTAAATDEVTEEDLLARQQDLLDRFTELTEKLSNEVKRLKLVQDRVQVNIQQMDRLVSSVRDGRLKQVSDDGRELVDQLRELALHIDAMAQSEPTNRISALRDMTTSLANMEREMSETTRTAIEAKERHQPAQATVHPEDVGELDSELQSLRTKTARLGSQLSERVATVGDVLRNPVELANLEAGEVSDRLQKFLDESELLEQLSNSVAAAAQIADAKESAPWSVAARQRALEYADAAAQLDQLYRQLVMPRSDQLRRLEGQCAQLAQVLSGQSACGMSDKDQPPSEMPQVPMGGSAEMQRRELEQGLRSAELNELAELLSGGDADQPASEMLEAEADVSDAAYQAVDNVNRRSNQFSPRGNAVLYGNVLRVQKELRGRIQELIMLEISADRNVPIPPQYRDLVDRYFSTIAGETTSSVHSPEHQPPNREEP